MYESLFNSLVTTIRGWIQDKIDSIHDHHEETLDARDETLGYRNEAATSASSAATSEANAAGAVQAAITDLVDQAPETLDTLSELADALGNDPNFATTVSNEIGLRAKTSDVNAAMLGKSNIDHTHVSSDFTDAVTSVGPGTPNGKVVVSNGGELMRAGTSDPTNTAALVSKYYVDKYLAQRAPSTHTHPIAQIDATGTPTATSYLRGDGSWQVPPNTTFGSMAEAEGRTGTSGTFRVVSAERLRDVATWHGVAQATPGSGLTLWTGTQSAYDDLPSGTKNAAGFVAIISG